MKQCTNRKETHRKKHQKKPRKIDEFPHFSILHWVSTCCTQACSIALCICITLLCAVHTVRFTLLLLWRTQLIKNRFDRFDPIHKHSSHFNQMILEHVRHVQTTSNEIFDNQLPNDHFHTQFTHHPEVPISLFFRFTHFRFVYFVTRQRKRDHFQQLQTIS